MKKVFNITVGIIGLYKVISSFIYPYKPTTLLTFEINIWIYRVIWSLVVIAISDYLYKEFKK